MPQKSSNVFVILKHFGILTLWYLHVVFSSLKHLIPKPAFKVGLHLGQVVICRRASTHSHMNVVKEIKTKINQSPSHRQSITFNMAFVQMPASCSDDQASNLLIQFSNRTLNKMALLQLIITLFI